MKKVGRCQNCGREVYTNDINLCKRCYQEFGLEFLKEEAESIIEEETPKNLEELGIKSTEKETEESAEEEAETQEQTEEVKKQ